MSEERFLEFVQEVYYYILDESWTKLKNVLFLFTNECNSKNAMLLYYLAKHYDLDYLFDYMDSIRRGISIDLKAVEKEYLDCLRNGNLEYAKYLLDFIDSKGKGNYLEINMSFLKFAYNYTEYKINGKRYPLLDDDLMIEYDLFEQLKKEETIKDIVSTDKLISLKKEFIMSLYDNIDQYSCTDKKGRYHIFAKVNALGNAREYNSEEFNATIERELYYMNNRKAKELVCDELLHTSGFKPELVRMYNELTGNEKTLRLERHICPPKEYDASYNVLYDFNYNIEGIDELVKKALKNKPINISSYTNEEQGLVYGIIAREAYKSNNVFLGDRYFKMACNYRKKNPEVNYFLKYVDENKGKFSFQLVRSLTEEVKQLLKK